MLQTPRIVNTESEQRTQFVTDFVKYEGLKLHVPTDTDLTSGVAGVSIQKGARLGDATDTRIHSLCPTVICYPQT